MISYLLTWTSASCWWRVIHLDQKMMWWTIPRIYWFWQLGHEIVAVGLWASGAAQAMCCQRILWSAVCKRTETNTSKSCRCVFLRVHAHIHTHLHCSFSHIWNTVCHLAHRCTFTHPQMCVCVHTQTHTHTYTLFPSHFCSSSWLWCIIGHSYAIV